MSRQLKPAALTPVLVTVEMVSAAEKNGLMRGKELTLR